jgi:gliding motility-associated-like protein
MKKCFFTFIFISYALIGYSQFTDDFSDGNFTSNPVWIGDVGNFEVDSLEKLHLNDTISNTSYLATESKAIINGIWEFEVKMSFAPSSSNYSKVYLISDEQDLTSSLNGYYVRIGGQSGTIDDVSLYIQNGSSTTKIIDGADGIAATNPDLKIKVSRDSIGNWELFADTSNQYLLQGAVFNNTITSSNYFGVYCKYTVSRSDKFWFDNFDVSGTYDTTTPPQINTNDIIINEIFADPTPPIGLPEYEYIELYNTTASVIDLTDWTLTIGTTDKVFPASTIEVDSFVILVKDADIDSFPNNISKIGFSSFLITNNGTSITLKNTSDNIINTVNFTDNWYNDTYKDDGGWSLELINPNSLCLGKENWSASNNVLGGTPGRKNSIFSNQNNLDSLYITNVFASGVFNVIAELSRGLDSLQLANTSNYFISNLGTPNSVALSNNNETITLTFSDSLISGITYVFQLQNTLSDCLGNSIDTTIQHTFYLPFTASANEVVINEVFCDETPSIGLPESEYIELYNNTNKLFSLSGWKLVIGGSEKDFPDAVIEPDSFVILIKEGALDSFPNNISRIGFSSISLTNGGADIVLKDNNGKIINAISYTDKWYNDDNKSEGGWSIERVNPNLYCEGKNNWRASIANIGGTPGKQNSVFGESIYIDNFRITKAFIIDSNKVKVHFNKKLDSLLVVDSSFFEINGNIPIKSSAVAPFFNAVNLTFNFSFLTQTTYTISANNLMDCSGNLLSNSMIFGVPDSVLENNIIINEVLFNPKDNGVDYVEIYNKTNSYFDLSKLRIANFFVLGNQINPVEQEVITEEPHLFTPKSYLVLTTDSAKVKMQYQVENPYAFVELASMPTLSNAEGTICLAHQSLNQIIDAFAYHEDMHFPLLETEDGVSLERLDKDAETKNTNNWHSAASTVGFGTPTYKNSQQYISQSIGEMNIEPKVFSPNNDGYHDVVAINWNFNKTNLMATIRIFDSNGRAVKTLVNNEMIGNSGSKNWDGTSEEGLQLATGIYIVWMEVFSQNAVVERYKKVAVLNR